MPKPAIFNTAMDHPAPHDRFFRGLLSYPEAAEDLVRCLMPPGVPAPRPGSVKLESGSYISEDLRGAYSDALFSCDFEGLPGFVHSLIEHQTTVPRAMALRTTWYSADILKNWAKANPNAEAVPVVLSFVIYQGTRKWSAPTQLLDLSGFSPEVKERLRVNALSGGYLLVNLQELDLARFRCGLILRLGFGLMKAVIDDQATEWLERNGENLSDLLTRPNGSTILRLMLNYISREESQRRNPSTLREIAYKVANQKVQREIMTILEEAKEEGHKEGREEGLRKGVLIGEIRGRQASLGQRQYALEELRASTLDELEAKLNALRTER